MPAMIVLGDKIDHGGEVIEASGATDTHRKQIARVGDKVYCPRKGHGTTVITTGDITMVIDGRAVAYHGCKTSCGATLISSQAVSTVIFGGGAGSAASSSVASNSQWAKAAAATPMKFDFDEQVRAVDARTGEPIPDLAYYIETPNGEHYSGHTDTKGHCQRVGTFQPDELAVWFGEEAELKQAK